MAVTSLLIFFIVGNALASSSGCKDSQLNISSDVCWDCIYPIKMGSVEIATSPTNLPDGEDDYGFICNCPCIEPPYEKTGIVFSYWEPSRLIETVKTPYCFPTLGMQTGDTTPGQKAGSNQKNHTGMHGTTFAQAHYYIFAVMEMVDSMLASECKSDESSVSLDLEYMTEVDSMWNDEMTENIMNAQGVLFASQYAQFACLADSVAVTVTKLPIDELYWCMAADGPVYPIAGHINMENLAEANFGLAARMLYKMAADFMVCDPAVNPCNCLNLPIWIKHHYRFQIARPTVANSTAYPIGYPGLLWDWGKNPPFSSGNNTNDNFSWILFRKKACCMFLD